MLHNSFLKLQLIWRRWWRWEWSLRGIDGRSSERSRSPAQISFNFQQHSQQCMSFLKIVYLECNFPFLFVFILLFINRLENWREAERGPVTTKAGLGTAGFQVYILHTHVNVIPFWIHIIEIIKLSKARFRHNCLTLFHLSVVFILTGAVLALLLVHVRDLYRLRKDLEGAAGLTSGGLLPEQHHLEVRN